MYIATVTFISLSGRAYKEGQEISWLRYQLLSALDKKRFKHHSQLRKEFEAEITRSLVGIATQTAQARIEREQARHEMENWHPHEGFGPSYPSPGDTTGAYSLEGSQPDPIIDLVETAALEMVDEAIIINSPSDDGPNYEVLPEPDSFPIADSSSTDSTTNYDNSSYDQPDGGSPSSDSTSDSSSDSGGSSDSGW